MIRVTIDIFSGRPNPSWLLDESEAQDVVRKLRDVKKRGKAHDGPGRLGYRGVIVEPDATLALDADLANAFRIGEDTDDSEGLAIVEQLVDRMGEPIAAAGSQRGLFADLDLKSIVKAEIRELRGSSRSPVGEGEVSALAGATVIGTDASSWTTQTEGSCQIEVAAFNPSFWNAANVQPYNNCYNYATNRRTDTFAQPGRATGAQARRMRCANVQTGAVSDGASPAGTCVTSSTEAPRWYMALVIWPGTDYHWYRKSEEGFWGHKPGQTAAKNTDNSGVVITNPETANRGGYRDFCGYLYARAGMVVQ